MADIMLLLIVFTAFIAVTLLTMALASIVRPVEDPALRRLEKLAKNQVSHREVELETPLVSRLFRPVGAKFLALLQRYTPKETLDRVRRKLILAGHPWGMEAIHFIGFKLVMTGGVAGIVLLARMPVGQKLLVGVVGALIGYILPDSMLNSKIRNRQQEIQKSLPDVLDLLTVSVEAGLGFDSAVAKVVAKSEGALAEEFNRILQEIRMGKPRQDALRDMAERVDLEDLSTFVAALVQADQLGVSIGKVLRIQSAEMRRKRRQRAEEAAMKAPIKMLIPMVIFIFPTIFIILLGPAAIRVMKVFSGQ